jgi:Tfp pilus assembly protein FimT
MKMLRTSKEIGFSLVELVVVVAIIMLITAMAIPQARNMMRSYRLNAATASIKSTVQSTRYQAIMVGCPYRVAFTTGSVNYQLSTQAITGTPPACSTSYSNVGGTIPWSTTPEAAISANTTLQFNPNGTVTASTGNSDLSISLAGVTRSISVSGVGNVTIH